MILGKCPSRAGRLPPALSLRYLSPGHSRAGHRRGRHCGAQCGPPAAAATRGTATRGLMQWEGRRKVSGNEGGRALVDRPHLNGREEREDDARGAARLSRGAAVAAAVREGRVRVAHDTLCRPTHRSSGGRSLCMARAMTDERPGAEPPPAAPPPPPCPPLGGLPALLPSPPAPAPAAVRMPRREKNPPPALGLAPPPPPPPPAPGLPSSPPAPGVPPLASSPPVALPVTPSGCRSTSWLSSSRPTRSACTREAASAASAATAATRPAMTEVARTAARASECEVRTPGCGSHMPRRARRRRASQEGAPGANPEDAAASACSGRRRGARVSESSPPLAGHTQAGITCMAGPTARRTMCARSVLAACVTCLRAAWRQRRPALGPAPAIRRASAATAAARTAAAAPSPTVPPCACPGGTAAATAALT